MTAFENKVNYYRKATEVYAALREQLTAMQHVCDELKSSIIEELGQKPELFNIATDKLVSIGRVGNNLFTVAYGKRVVRKGETRSGSIYLVPSPLHWRRK